MERTPTAVAEQRQICFSYVRRLAGVATKAVRLKFSGEHDQLVLDITSPGGILEIASATSRWLVAPRNLANGVFIGIQTRITSHHQAAANSRSICSKLLPLVSGTRSLIKKTPAKQIAAYSQNIPADPNALFRIGKV